MKLFMKINFAKTKLFFMIFFVLTTNSMILRSDFNDFQTRPFFGLNNGPIINDPIFFSQPQVLPNLYMNRQLKTSIRKQNNSGKKSNQELLKTQIRKMKIEINNMEKQIGKNKRRRKMQTVPPMPGSGGGGKGSNKPTVIDIPIPKIRETQLEVVHVFPDSFGMTGPMGGSGGGGMYGGDQYSNFMPSFSVKSTTDGTEKVNNFWGYNTN